MKLCDSCGHTHKPCGQHLYMDVGRTCAPGCLECWAQDNAARVARLEAPADPSWIKFDSGKGTICPKCGHWNCDGNC